MDEPVPIPITDVFDLHSVPPRDVEAVVEAYLEEARKLGLKALRIIHGRGIGVQREIVRAVLARTEGVVAFGDAPCRSRRLGRYGRDAALKLLVRLAPLQLHAQFLRDHAG